MQMYKSVYWQHTLNDFFIQKTQTINNTIKTTILKTASQSICALLLLSFTSFTSMVNAATITAEMSPEVVTEYNKLLAAQTWPQLHTKLALMDNPYKKFTKALKKTLKAEAPEGKRRREMTPEESIMAAKKKRFDYCQASVEFFVSFSARVYTLTRVEQQPLTKEQLMTGNGVKYPFTEEEANNPGTRPAQIALDLGWTYQGKGESYAETFLATCLAIPVDLYL